MIASLSLPFDLCLCARIRSQCTPGEHSTIAYPGLTDPPPTALGGALILYLTVSFSVQAMFLDQLSLDRQLLLCA